MTQLDLLTVAKPGIDRGALLTKAYRWLLWRVWDTAHEHRDLWVGLNPSFADAEVDDLTVKKVCGFSRRWGSTGGVFFGNLFGLRSTDPSALLTHRDPIGPFNDTHLFAQAELVASSGGRLIVAWGDGGELHGRGVQVAAKLAQFRAPLLCLGHTKAGHPKHPSRLGYDTPLVPFQGYA